MGPLFRRVDNPPMSYVPAMAPLFPLIAQARAQNETDKANMMVSAWYARVVVHDAKVSLLGVVVARYKISGCRLRSPPLDHAFA